MIADCLTVSRAVCSLILLLFAPSSVPFAVLYLWCGVSDMLDGWIARTLHTASGRGAVLDSAADLLFAAVYAVKILPLLSLPLWIWVWTAGIALGKGIVIFRKSKKERKLSVLHSFANKLTGLLLFLYPLTLRLTDATFGAIAVCAAATLALFEDVRGKKTENG